MLQAVVLGAIQGLTEFLPISSSAHLTLAHWLFGWRAPPELELAFDVALHLGTLLALLIYFRREWVRLATDPSQRKLAGLIIVACLPGGVAGLLLEKQAESVFRDPLRIAILLGAIGLVMQAADSRGAKQRRTEETKLSDALIIGCSQTLALMPGVSRSGITLASGLICGFTRESAARFSFLISMPIIAGATLWQARHFGEIAAAGIGPQMLGGIVSAAVFGYVTIDRLLRYLQTRSLLPFVVYRLAIAALVIVVYCARQT